jgi:hypothetical protein
MPVTLLAEELKDRSVVVSPSSSRQPAIIVAGRVDGTSSGTSPETSEHGVGSFERMSAADRKSKGKPGKTGTVISLQGEDGEERRELGNQDMSHNVQYLLSVHDIDRDRFPTASVGSANSQCRHQRRVRTRHPCWGRTMHPQPRWRVRRPVGKHQLLSILVSRRERGSGRVPGSMGRAVLYARCPSGWIPAR